MFRKENAVFAAKHEGIARNVCVVCASLRVSHDGGGVKSVPSLVCSQVTGGWAGLPDGRLARVVFKV